MVIKIIDDTLISGKQRPYDVWPSEIDVKVDKKPAMDLLAKFQNPREKVKP